MKEQEKALRKLVEDIYTTQELEIQCEEAGIQMVLSADAQLADEASRRQYPALWHHMRFCSDCRSEYEVLGELARLEAEGRLVRPARIPRPPSLEPPASRLKNIVSALFPGFSLAPAALQRSLAMGSKPVTVILGAGELTVDISVAASEAAPESRDVFCAVTAAHEALSAAIEGAIAWLEETATGARHPGAGARRVWRRRLHRRGSGPV